MTGGYIEKLLLIFVATEIVRPTAKNEEYKIAINKAVCDSGETDAYTNEDLDWYLRGKSEEDISIAHLPFAMQSAESVVFEFLLF